MLPERVSVLLPSFVSARVPLRVEDWVKLPAVVSIATPEDALSVKPLSVLLLLKRLATSAAL